MSQDAEDVKPKQPSTDPASRFADATIEGINIRSIVDSPRIKAVKDKDGKSYAQGERVQTEKLSLVNRRVQACELKDEETQYSIDDLRGDDDRDKVDDDQVVEFLRRVGPIMEEELKYASQSMLVFDQYKPLWDDMEETCEMTHQVFKDGFVDLEVTSVAWNSTGATLACSYGKLDTLGWCDVSAPVCLWNVFRPQLVAGEPDTVIQAQGFVMCLAFHPTKPGVLAGGSYNGELLIWDIASNDLDPLVASSSIDDYFHREAIQAVEWITADLSGDASAYLIATASGDGKVLIWDARENDLSYPSRGFMLIGSKKRVLGELGGRSLSFSPLDPWLFVVGCENGNVMRAFRSPPGATMGKPQGHYNWKPAAVALLDQLAGSSRLSLQHHVEAYCRSAGVKEVTAEVVFQSKPDPAVIFPAPKTTDLEGHAGPVTVASFSPFFRKLLLTASIDGSVRLYDVLQQRAILTLYPPAKHLSTCAVSAAGWSSARPCVFAVAMEMGGVYVYDLLESTQEPVLTLPVQGSQQGTGPMITSLAFNPKQRGLLAVGDSNMRVGIYRLPFKFADQQKAENAAIVALMASGK